MPKGIWMWDRHCVPFLGFSQIARILFFLRQPHMWLSFLGIFFFESCFVLRFPGIMCSSKPPPAALCTQNNLTTFIPTSNTTSLNSANVFPGGTHALSIIPSIIWHPIIWSVLSIWGTFFFLFFFFSVLIAQRATWASLLLHHRYSHHLWQEVSPGLSELSSCPNPPMLSTPDPRGNCPCYTPCWETAGPQRGSRRGREGNCR